jgi:phosphoserine phosphatase
MARLGGVLFVVLVGCSRPAPTAQQETFSGFSPVTRAALQQLLRDVGRGSARFDAAHPPVATLDWDNTMVRMDVGDLGLFHALANNGLVAPPAWDQVDPALAPAAVAMLEAACKPAGAPGQKLATATHPDCTNALLDIYLEEKLADGTPAFALPDTPSIKRSYLFGARLWQGQTPQQVRDAATAAWAWGTAQPVGATVVLGRHTVASWIRLQPPMVDLVAALRAAGVEVWIVSASAQQLVEVAASHVGIAPNHVLGVQLQVDAQQRLKADLVTCGEDGVERMPFGDGKRCVINRTILALPPAQHTAVAPAAQRAVLAAGDSDGDVPMLQDATHVRLALNRGRSELMCHALHNADRRWFVEPLFVDPLPPRGQPFGCGGWRDPTGAVIPDQPPPH